MTMITDAKTKIRLEMLVVILLCVLLCGCQNAYGKPNTATIGETKMERNSISEINVQQPYAVKSVLKESSTVDPDTGTGVYSRYTVLTAADDAPETFKKVIAACNRRAEAAVRKHMLSIPSELSVKALQEKSGDYRFETYAYIVTITRADPAAFSILETEYKAGLPDAWKGRKVSCRFRGSTFDMASGKEIPLSALAADPKALRERLEKALKVQYGTTGLAGTEPAGYSWTADALGIRFYFNSDAVSKEKRKEIGDYSDKVITVALPYDTLDGSLAGKLSDVPEAYIARIDRETVYDLPHGDFSVMLTKNDAGTILRMLPDNGQESSRIIEYADDQSDFYIIRSRGGFYLFRQRIGYQEGFFYDFSRPDGGYGRFAYHPSPYFDSFMREIRLALPYDPYCAHMCEVHRSFGETSSDASSFVPHGHYSFPDDTNSRYKRFVLIDGTLQIDTLNTACRLLEDMSAVELDQKGGELGEVTIKAGSAIVFESVTGEAGRYQVPPQRGRQDIRYVYDCHLADGRKIRIFSDTVYGMFVNKKYLNRFSEPVSLAEARIDITPPRAEAFTVRMGGKEYPVIPDYSKPNHTGEEINFGEDVWWQAEGYVGQYEMTAADFLDMQNNQVADSKRQAGENSAVLTISEDGKIRFDYYGKVYEGVMPGKRYYGVDVAVGLKSQSEYRAFSIILRNDRHHDAPSRIEFHSEGLPATNEPSKQPPLTVYLTKTDRDIPER